MQEGAVNALIKERENNSNQLVKVRVINSIGKRTG
jgi:hypothetical protein